MRTDSDGDSRDSSGTSRASATGAKTAPLHRESTDEAFRKGVAAELAENVEHKKRQDKADADRDKTNRGKYGSDSDKDSRDRSRSSGTSRHSAMSADTPPLDRGYAEVAAGKKSASSKSSDRDEDTDRDSDRNSYRGSYRGENAMSTSIGGMIDGRKDRKVVPPHRQPGNQRATANTANNTRDGNNAYRGGTNPTSRSWCAEPRATATFNQYRGGGRPTGYDRGGRGSGEGARPPQAGIRCENKPPGKQGPCKWYFRDGKPEQCSKPPGKCSFSHDPQECAERYPDAAAKRDSTASSKAAIAKVNDGLTTDSSTTENETQLRNLNESFNEVEVTPAVKKRKSGDNSSSSSSSGESRKESKTEPKDESSSSASSNNANSNISGNLPSTTRVQQETPPEQGGSNKNGMKPRTEEIAELQARFDSAQLRLDEYAQEVKDLKEHNEELKDSEAWLESQWKWLWGQVQTFAHHKKDSNTVLMVIEPEKSKSSWETWVMKDGKWVERKAILLLTTDPFKIKGHAHCKFIMRWFTGTSRMEKVKEKEPQNPFTRSHIVSAKIMQEVRGLKKHMIKLLRKCTTCEKTVPNSTRGCEGCKNRVGHKEQDDSNNDDSNNDNSGDEDKDDDEYDDNNHKDKEDNEHEQK